MRKHIILQTVAPDYRGKLYEYIKKEFGDLFVVYAGLEYFEPTVKTDTGIQSFHKVNNHFLLKRSFLIQTGMWLDVIRCQTLVMEMNPRIISNWITLIIRKVLRKRTILWGHAWPRSGMQSKTDRIRKIMRDMGDNIIVYTRSQMEELKTEEPHLNINYAPNALYYKDEMKVNKETPSHEINNLIYVGRLTKLKKPLLLLKAFHKALPELNENSKLYFVGDGDEKESLENYIDQNGLKNRVVLTGHIGDYFKLEILYSKSIFSVSPGYIGLSVTQSFGFGVPMLVSRNENHSPEIEAVEDGVNALFFETDNLESFKERIIQIYNEKQQWIDKREDVCETCKENYSINAMGDTFIRLFHKK